MSPSFEHGSQCRPESQFRRNHTETGVSVLVKPCPILDCAKYSEKLSGEGHQVVFVSRMGDSLTGLPGVTHLHKNPPTDDLTAAEMPVSLDSVV